MFYIIPVAGLLVLAFTIGKLTLSFQFNKEVNQLFAQSNPLSGSRFSFEQLVTLPAPVQRYFKYALKDGQPYISYARITHSGKFKTGFDKNWINIKGEQYATTGKPGFIWKGTTSMFTARDMFIADKGRLVVSLFSLYNVVDARGEQYDQGELLRWLGESIMYPTNLLPGERVQWLPIDDKKATLTFSYNKLLLFFVITFNDTGEITEMETKRYMDDKNLETWIIKLAKYREINSVIVPTAFVVLWRLEKGDFSYAKFNLEKIEYDKPARFRGK